jgi:hypothetical protein
MRKSTLLLFCLFKVLLCQAQLTDIKILKVDINANGQVDIIQPRTKDLAMKIDNKNYTLAYERLGFEFLSALSFKNNVLTITGGNSGTGGYSWTYKFRNNKLTKKIELIGYDDFGKWVSGNITTSVNMLTSKWEVMVTELNHAKNVMDTTKHTGNISIKKIELTDIKDQDINKLWAVSQKYWP